MKIISIITNNPIFIELQFYSLKKYLDDITYEYIVFNDGKNWPDATNFGDPKNEGKEAIEQKCKELGVICINLTNDQHKKYTSASKRHCDSLRYLVNFMKNNIDEYLILDGDMFLIDKLNVEQYRSKMCACVLQARPQYQLRYIWPNLFYMNMNKIKHIDLFRLGVVPHGDTGSGSSDWLKKFDYVFPTCEDLTQVNGVKCSNKLYENDDFYFIKHLQSCVWTAKELSENLKNRKRLINFLDSDFRNKNGKYFCEIYDNCVFHYRAGTWHKMDRKLHKINLEKLKDLI